MDSYPYPTTEYPCYLCGRITHKLDHEPWVAFLIDDDNAEIWIGPECYRKVKKAQDKGFKHRKGGPRVFHTREFAINYNVKRGP